MRSTGEDTKNSMFPLCSAQRLGVLGGQNCFAVIFLT